MCFEALHFALQYELWSTGHYFSLSPGTNVLQPGAPFIDVVDPDTNVLYYGAPLMEVVDIDTNALLSGASFIDALDTLT